ncbi:MAG: hypothetical protein Hens3KO_15850 [Henriciella sp.]
MPPYLQNLTKMLAIWNSSDPLEIAALTEAALEHNVHFVDPNHNIIGRDAFIKMVHLVHQQIPSAVYSHTSRIDMQNNHCRYHWAIHNDGQLLMPGFDVTEVNDAGKIVKIIGFFGELDNNTSA